MLIAESEKDATVPFTKSQIDSVIAREVAKQVAVYRRRRRAVRLISPAYSGYKRRVSRIRSRLLRELLDE